MTPLGRKFLKYCPKIELGWSCHFFDCTQLEPLVISMMDEWRKTSWKDLQLRDGEKRFFTPCDNVWIDLTPRLAYVIRKNEKETELARTQDDCVPNEEAYDVYVINYDGGKKFRWERMGFITFPSLNLAIDPWVEKEIRGADKQRKMTGADVATIISSMVAMLYLINTPHLLVKVQNNMKLPMANLKQRHGKIAGNFSPVAWTQIKLEVSRDHLPLEYTERNDLTGGKCLHFVRAHLRHLANGDVIKIVSHWRGDPKLGIKLSYYDCSPAEHELDRGEAA